MRRKKGFYGCKSASFKRGHGCFFKRERQDSTEEETVTCLKYVRLPEDVINSALLTLSTDHGAQLLRDCPSPATATLLEKTCKRNNRNSSREVMKLYLPIKVENLWNEAVHEHVEKSRGCTGKLMFDETGEKKVGLCWRERLKCSDCPYVSTMHKLYTEVSTPGKRGQKPAAPNLGVQVGLSSTGNSSLRNVLNAANIPSPAKSGMQKNTNRVADHLVKVNQDDMSEICRDIGKINEAKGLPTDAAIRVEADARYNKPLYSGSDHTPFQPATQAVYTVCENTTPKKKIISISSINKLCQKCALNLKKNSGDRKCDQCSANISSHQSIGDERTWAKQCLQDLDDKNVKVKNITTDCDSRAADAAQQMYEEARYTERPTQLKDTRHLGGSQRRMVKNVVFSAGMFPGKTKKIREEMQCRFAHDVARDVQKNTQLHSRNMGMTDAGEKDT